MKNVVKTVVFDETPSAEAPSFSELKRLSDVLLSTELVLVIWYSGKGERGWQQALLDNRCGLTLL